MTTPALWHPPADARSATRMGRFADWAEADTGRSFPDYHELWRWSTEDVGAFWQSVWRYFDIPASGSDEPALVDPSMPFATWFPDTRVNYAEAMLRLPGRSDNDVVVRSRSQTRVDSTLTTQELRDSVGRVRAGLVELGVTSGDRVAAYLPNIPEALVLMLACASLGAVYSACPPEFGVTNVVERWSQIEPSLLVTVDGYVYGERRVDRTGDVDRIASALGLSERTVVVPYLDTHRPLAEGSLTWAWLTRAAPDLRFERMPFDHPLWILFSSGTTGLPKPIVHGHGGVTLELHKHHGLHLDLGPRDTFFWYSTTGWVMWNLLVSGLMVGSTVVTFDGNPGSPDLGELWRLASNTGVTYFGVSAPYLMNCRKTGLRPSDHGDVSNVREVGATGAPLPAEGFHWLYDELGPELRVNSMSGGTDVCTSFVGGSPLLPVRAGEIACRQLACRVEAWDEAGRAVLDDVGEMVVTAPMPSMPLRFWGDDDGERYRSAYFERWPGIWRHGDWITISRDGHCAISGRSDATLNRGGVRLGTSEFYRCVEELGSVADSLVVHLESTDGGAGELILFVVPAAGNQIDTNMRMALCDVLRKELSPRHVPDTIREISEVPRTLSGKKLEVPVKKILSGERVRDVVDPESLTNPTSLSSFTELANQRDRSAAG